MYRISVRHHFDAAHYLRNCRGKCEELHGHRFEVVVTVETDELDSAGMAFDFTELKGQLWEILERFDHVCLNDITPFDKINPSSENIASTIHREFKTRLREAPVSIYSIQVWESPNSWVTYVP